jgi:signal transduction histidine kinase
MKSPGEQRKEVTSTGADCGRHSGRSAVVGIKQRSRSAQEDLTRAFLTFTQAAGSLERSYSQLQAEVARLHQELERANTELDRSLQENTRVRGYLSKLLERLPCGVLAANENGEMRLLNPEARRLLDISNDWKPVPGQGAPEALQRVLGEAQERGSKNELEMELGTSRGNRIIGILHENISEDGLGKSESIWILRDLTEQRRTAEEREAARRSQALAEVATVLAHEIRNPLGSMELFTGLLADASAHLPETRQWITHLRAGLRALSSTVNNVLHFHGQSAPRLVPSDLERLLRETVDFLQPMARQRGQTIKLENKIGLVTIQADSNRLKQVFFNLALNAFRAMPPGGTLTVRLGWSPQFPEGAVRIDFADEGRGIDNALLSRIFEPGVTTLPGSPGLGLAVCKKIVEQHHGEIEVQSKPQQGTTFSLTFAVYGAPA